MGPLCVGRHGERGGPACVLSAGLPAPVSRLLALRLLLARPALAGPALCARPPLADTSAADSASVAPCGGGRWRASTRRSPPPRGPFPPLSPALAGVVWLAPADTEAAVADLVAMRRAGVRAVRTDVVTDTRRAPGGQPARAGALAGPAGRGAAGRLPPAPDRAGVAACWPRRWTGRARTRPHATSGWPSRATRATRASARTSTALDGPRARAGRPGDPDVLREPVPRGRPRGADGRRRAARRARGRPGRDAPALAGAARDAGRAGVGRRRRAAGPGRRVADAGDRGGSGADAGGHVRRPAVARRRRPRPRSSTAGATSTPTASSATSAPR